MAVIDEKGRLFGKINIIDLFAALTLLLIIPIFYLGIKITYIRTAATPETPKQYTNIELDCMLNRINQEISQLITVGDQEVDTEGTAIGKLTYVGDIEKDLLNIDIGNQTILSAIDLGNYKVPAKIWFKVWEKDNNLYYKDSRIAIGSPLEFKTAKYKVAALPYTPRKERSLKIDLYLTLKEIPENITAMISAGDKEIDENGNAIIEILDVGKITVNTYTFTTGELYKVTEADTNKKEVTVRARMLVQIVNDEELYYKGQRLTGDSNFLFKAEHYSAKVKLAKVLLKETLLRLQVKFTGIIPELASLVQVNDMSRDADGRIKGSIVSIIENKTSEIQVLTVQENKFISIPNLTQRDITLSLDLVCEEKDGTLYYRAYPVKVGNMLVFTTNLYSLTGTVIGIMES